MKTNWSSASQAVRKRKKVSFTLSDEARVKLARMSVKRGKEPLSAVVERLIMEAEE